MRYLTFIFLLLSIVGSAQTKLTSEGEARTRISTLEKQNKVAQGIPLLLLQAWCNGEISAYFPKDHSVKMTYAQFLEHFGMEQRAYTVLDNQAPSWYCEEAPLECVPIDLLTMNCLQYEVELGEENYFNRTTSRQEKKLTYVKLIYSSTCTVRGIEMEGPVFKLGEIKKLDKRYKVQNAQNDAASLPIWSYLTLGNFNRTTVYRKQEFVSNPARVTADEQKKRNTKENENWSR